LAIGSVLYNGLLILYYTLVIRYGYTDAQLRRVELWGHAGVSIFVLGTAFAAIGLGKLNPAGSACWIANRLECYEDPVPAGIKCDAKYFSTAFFCIPLWIIEFSQIFGLSLIYCKVRTTHKRLERYSLNGTEINARRRSSKDTRSVAFTAFLYSVAFFVTWVASTVYSVGQFWHLESYPLWMVTVILEPLQGVWNLIIFLRSRPESRRSLYSLFCSPCEKRREQDKDTSNSSSSGRTGVTGPSSRSFKLYSSSRRTSSKDQNPSQESQTSADATQTHHGENQEDSMSEHHARWFDEAETPVATEEQKEESTEDIKQVVAELSRSSN